jgi:hypothetical protein
MFDGRTLRSISLRALLIATIIQGMTADARDLASSSLLQRLVRDPATRPCDVHDDQLPNGDESMPSRDGDDEAAQGEVCVLGEPDVVAATSRRNGVGTPRSRSPWLIATQPLVQPTAQLRPWSLGATSRGRHLTLALCRLTC